MRPREREKGYFCEYTRDAKTRGQLHAVDGSTIHHSLLSACTRRNSYDVPIWATVELPASLEVNQTSPISKPSPAQATCR